MRARVLDCDHRGHRSHYYISIGNYVYYLRADTLFYSTRNDDYYHFAHPCDACGPRLGDRCMHQLPHDRSECLRWMPQGVCVRCVRAQRPLRRMRRRPLDGLRRREDLVCPTDPAVVQDEERHREAPGAEPPRHRRLAAERDRPLRRPRLDVQEIQALHTGNSSILYEYCCHEKTEISKAANKHGILSRRLGLHNIGLSQPREITKLLDVIQSDLRRGRGVAVWASLPCTPWCTYQRINRLRGPASAARLAAD